MQKADEVLVVALARTGDSDAFTELVRRKQSWLRAFMQRCCGDAVLADDLAQQTFMQAWTAIGRLRDARRFNGWLKKLAVNVWLKHQRDDRQPPDTHLRTNQQTHAPGESADNLESTTTTRPDISIDLDQALLTLAKPVRTCIVLAYHEGMSHTEISTITGLPLGTVKSHIRRGGDDLKATLAAYKN